MWANIVFVFVCLFCSTGAQFPRICVSNITESKVCCPVPEGYTEPCGGAGRGHCEFLQPGDELFSPVLPQFSSDNRLDWPRKMFSTICICEGNFMGYMCQDCAFGYQGPNCDKKVTRVRKNIHNLSANERLRFRRALQKSKTTVSDYVILENIFDQDPLVNPRFRDVSVNGFYTYIHAYSTRDTLPLGEKTQCNVPPLYTMVPMRYDAGHIGPGFLPWHRIYMLLWEQDVRAASGDDTFMFPYWDWAAAADCDICTNDLLGEVRPDGYLDDGSIFHDWNTICLPAKINNCGVCGELTDERISRFPGQRNPLPTVDDLTRVMNQDVFTRFPYATAYGFTEGGGFAANMEGFLLPSNGPSEIHATMHGQVHTYFMGTMGNVGASPADPIFIPVHVFLDLMLERWMLKNNFTAEQYPDKYAPWNHNRGTRACPFFPPIKLEVGLIRTSDLGYVYEDIEAEPSDGKGTDEKMERQGNNLNVQNSVAGEGMPSNNQANSSSSQVMIGVSVTLSGLILIAVLVVYRKFRARSNDGHVIVGRHITAEDNYPEERDHLVS